MERVHVVVHDALQHAHQPEPLHHPPHLPQIPVRVDVDGPEDALDHVADELGRLEAGERRPRVHGVALERARDLRAVLLEAEEGEVLVLEDAVARVEEALPEVDLLRVVDALEPVRERPGRHRRLHGRGRAEAGVREDVRVHDGHLLDVHVPRAVVLALGVVEVVDDDHVERAVAEELEPLERHRGALALVARVGERLDEEGATGEAIVDHLLDERELFGNVVDVVDMVHGFDVLRELLPRETEIEGSGAVDREVEPAMFVGCANQGLDDVREHLSREVFCTPFLLVFAVTLSRCYCATRYRRVLAAV